jgi:DNA-directed RNA polymerase subunit alpha
MVVRFKCIGARKHFDKSLSSQFLIESVPRFYGDHIANSLRRLLYTQIQGLAVVAIEINESEGYRTPFCSIQGLTGTIRDLIANLKNITLKSSIPLLNLANGERIEGLLEAKGVGIVTARRFLFPRGYSVINKSHYITTINNNSKIFKVKLIFECGVGSKYLTKPEKSRFPSHYFVVEPVVFRPVIKVGYFISPSLRYPFSHLCSIMLFVTTDGSVEPILVLSLCTRLLVDISRQFYTASLNCKLETTNQKQDSTLEKRVQDYSLIGINTLKLSVRVYNALRKANIETLDDLLQCSKEKLLSIKGIGPKTLNEVTIQLQKNFGHDLSS